MPGHLTRPVDLRRKRPEVLPPAQIAQRLDEDALLFVKLEIHHQPPAESRAHAGAPSDLLGHANAPISGILRQGAGCWEGARALSGSCRSRRSKSLPSIPLSRVFDIQLRPLEKEDCGPAVGRAARDPERHRERRDRPHGRLTASRGNPGVPGGISGIPAIDTGARHVQQWGAFESQAASGNATIAFDETGVTSRGVEYIDEKNLPLEDLQVHFCPDGLGEASGTIKAPGPDIHVLLRGTLDLSGAKPRIDVREIKAGNLPGLFGGTDWIITNIVKKSNADILDVKPHLASIQIGDGSATLTGAP